MKLLKRICLGLLWLSAASLWSQDSASPSTQPAPAYGAGSGQGSATESSDDRMLTPPPVSGQSYPSSYTSGERSNYLRGGVAFTGAYTDNALGSVNGRPVGEASYSVAPFLKLDESMPRLHWALTYAPGFSFYQRTSSRNEADQNASIDLQYRLSPHVTLSAQDGFRKSSNVFNQPDLGGAAVVTGGTQEPNFSVIAPTADRLSNAGNAGISYQFAANGMVGVNGTFSNLHYPNEAEVPGLFDSSSQGASVFYSLRVSKMHYLGATYSYQRLVSYPTAGQNETQTHALFFFYTLYVTPRFSISLFGGPQHSDTVQPPLPAAVAWTPAAGASMSWQARLTNVAFSYSHVIAGGGGLTGAVQMDSASASVGQQLTRRLSGSVTGMYAKNNALGSAIAGNTNGNTVMGSASLQQAFGQHINVQLGYTRLHQNYSGVAVLAATPNTNRESITISYQFSKALGR